MKSTLILLSALLFVAVASGQATGYLDSATQYNAAGWACIPSQSWRDVYVEIYVDDRLAGSVLANQQREAAVGQQCGGNSRKGFSFSFTPSFQQTLGDGRSHRVRAYIQPYFPYFRRIELNNSPIVFTGYPTFPPTFPPTYPPTFPPSTAVGFLDSASTTNAAGWSCSPNNPNQYLQVNLYIDGNYVASTTANLPREPAVGQECGGNSYHGFSYNWSPNIQNLLNDGFPHTVAAYAIPFPSGQNFQLSGSPKTVIGTRIPPTNPPYGNEPKGYLDQVTTSYATGWACDLDSPGQAITVHIYANGVYLGQTVANLQREAAVGQQCGGYNNRGWRFNFPYYIQPGTQIAAYGINYPSGNNPQLSNSPQTVQ